MEDNDHNKLKGDLIVKSEALGFKVTSATSLIIS